MAKGAVAAAMPSYLNHNGSRPVMPEKPNILWITMEDTCPQFIGCYGNNDARTPNMDKLAAQGVRFNGAFSTAPVCSPSRSSIITGCLPEVLGTGHHRSQYPVPEFIKGFPYYLKQEGYYTTNNLKTDYNISNEGFVREAWNESFGAGGWGTAFENAYHGNSPDTWDENSKEAGWWHRKPGQPFFSVFNLFNSHQSRTMTNPYEWYVENVLERLPAIERISPEEISVPPFYRDTQEMRKYLSRVYNSLLLTDKEFGGIIDRLEQDGLKENTLVFCFADHGEGIPKGKISALGLGFQVPFFIYFPPKFQYLSPWPIGSSTDELVSSSEDVAPTVLSLAGVDIPKYMTGRPLIGAHRKAPRPYVWGGRNRIDESPDVSRCITDGRFFYTRVFMPQLPLVEYMKYEDVGDITRAIRADHAAGLLNAVQAELVEPRSVEYLYDLRKDTWQINNLADDPAHKSMLQILRETLYEHLLETRDIHFMPEYEMARRAKLSPPYDLRTDTTNYPFGRILDAAKLVGYPSSINRQLELLKDRNPIVRYWAAVGLDAQGNLLKPFKEDILQCLHDPHPPVQIVVAGIAYKLFGDLEARQVLEDFLVHEDNYCVLHTLQTIEYMEAKAMAFVPALHQLLERFSDKKGNMPYDITSMAEVILHFLHGEALYYREFSKWTPKKQMDRDYGVHF